MAGEYDINLSNGSVLTTLYPLETNGPDNRSTPRLVSQAIPTFPIVQYGGISPNGVVKLAGNHETIFQLGLSFDISGSVSNNGTYVVAAIDVPGSSPLTQGAWYDVGQNETNVIVTTAFPSATIDGTITINAFVLAGDIAYRFIPGFQFDVQLSAENDAQYTVDTFGSYFTGLDTIIPITVAIPGSILPLGQIQYSILDTNTTLKLPGKGTLNYGEMLMENAVRMTEHFAADDEPELNAFITGSGPAATPLVGQLWYKTLLGEEGFLHWDGTEWNNDIDVDSGSLIFRDVEDSNKDIFITASETNLPAPWAGGVNNQPGMVIWNAVNPADDASVLRVLASGGEELIDIEYNSIIHAGYIRSVNNLEIQSQGESYFYGEVGIGSDGLPTITNTLTVEGSGIDVNADTGLNANLVLNSSTGQTSTIEFSEGGVLAGKIEVNHATVGTPLEINSTTTNDVVLVTGGGSVGINEATPSATLDVVGSTELNGDVRVVSSDMIFDDGFGLESITGALLKTGGAGGTWQATAGNNTSASFIANDSTLASQFSIHETNGTEVLLGNFTVDTDTLYVDSTNDRVGINVIPSYPLDVLGDTQISGYVGINNVPPTGSVRLEVTGDIQANSQIRGSSQTATDPTFTFTNDLDTGMYNPAPDALGFAVGGVLQLYLSTSGLTFSSGQLLLTDGTDTAPSFSFTNHSDTGMYHDTANNELGFAVDGTKVLGLEANGTLSIPTTSYETLVLADNDIPNKKYTDDKIAELLEGISWREPVDIHSQTNYADSSSFPTTGTIDDETIFTGMRALFSDVTLVADRDVWIFDGATWILEATNTRSIGDTVYVKLGTDFGKAFAFNQEDEWTLISGKGGGGTFFIYEKFVATAGQSLFTLANAYKPTADGNRLLVFVDGIKYIYGIGYTETSSLSVTLLPPVAFFGGEEVEFYILAEAAGSASLKREEQTGLTGTPVITFTLISYTQNSDGLLVYMNGQKMIIDKDYTETSNNSITWIGVPLLATDVFEFYSGVPVVAGTLLSDIDDVSPGIPNNGDILVYNSTSGLWEVVTFGSYVEISGSTMTGFLTLNADPVNLLHAAPKQYVDTEITSAISALPIDTDEGVNVDELVAGGAQTIFNTVNVLTTAKTGARSFQQVFVNGILNKEGIGFAYNVTGVNQITFFAATPASADVTIYQL